MKVHYREGDSVTTRCGRLSYVSNSTKDRRKATCNSCRAALQMDKLKRQSEVAKERPAKGPDVRVGQVWTDTNYVSAPRKLRIVKVDDTHVWFVVIGDLHRFEPRRALLSRFHAHGRGYRRLEG